MSVRCSQLSRTSRWFGRGQVLLDRGLDGPVLALLDLQGLGDDRGHARGVAQRCQLDDGDAVVERVHGPSGDPHGQPGLAHPARSRHRHHRLVPEGVGQRGHIGIAPDERGHPHELWSGHPGGPALAGRPVRLPQARVVGQDPGLELLHGGRRDQAQVPRQQRAELIGPTQRLTLAPGAVEGHHQQPPVALAQGVEVHQRLELGHHRGRVTGLDPGFGPSVGGHQPELVEPQRLAVHLGKIGTAPEGGSAPQGERGLEHRDRLARAEGPASGRQRLEPERVDAVVGRVQPVAPRVEHDREIGGKRGTEAGNLALDRGRGRFRGAAGPEGLDQPVRRHGMPAMGDQHGEQLLCLRSAQRTHLALGVERETSEDAQLR